MYRKQKRGIIVNWLKKMRKSKKMTQQMVAEKCEISFQLYSHIETGRRVPRILVAKKIAKVLDFDWTRFYEDCEQ